MSPTNEGGGTVADDESRSRGPAGSDDYLVARFTFSFCLCLARTGRGTKGVKEKEEKGVRE